MSTLLISTRKGLFEATPTGSTFEVVRGHFIGDNVSIALADPRDGTWYAALDHGHFGVKLHRSEDRGASWKEITTPAYPKQPEGQVELNFWGKERKWATALIWSLVPALDKDGALWCGTIPGGLFRSDDRGETWRINEALWFHPDRPKWNGGGKDDAGIHSICVDPRDPRTVAIAVSTAGIWRTRDAGASWTNTAHGMRAEYVPPEQARDGLSQDVHCLVQSRSTPTTFWVQHHNGIFRSTDDMASWTEIEAARPSWFGFPVVADPDDANTAWFVPAIKDEKRIPVEGKVVVSRTRDGGTSFEVLSAGLPDRFAYDLVYRHAFQRSPEGALVFGSTTGNVFASTDRGERWQVVSNYLPPVHAITFAS